MTSKPHPQCGDFLEMKITKLNWTALGWLCYVKQIGLSRSNQKFQPCQNSFAVNASKIPPNMSRLFIKTLRSNTYLTCGDPDIFLKRIIRYQESIECSNLTLTNTSTFVWKYFRVKNTWLSPPQILPEITPKIFVKKNKYFRNNLATSARKLNQPQK